MYAVHHLCLLSFTWSKNFLLKLNAYLSLLKYSTIIFYADIAHGKL